MTYAVVRCYFCGQVVSAARRGKLCPKCGKRLPGVPSHFALGDAPQESLQGLIIWGWVFVGVAVVSALLTRVLSGQSPAHVGAAPVTFRYTAFTGHLAGAVVAVTLILAHIGASRVHGVVALGCLVLAGMAHAAGYW